VESTHLLNVLIMDVMLQFLAPTHKPELPSQIRWFAAAVMYFELQTALLEQERR
jgi:hypothetical protein